MFHVLTTINLLLPIAVSRLSYFFLQSPENIFSLLLEKGGETKGERVTSMQERHFNSLPPICTWTWNQTLTRNWTCDHLGMGCSNPMSHTSQGQDLILLTKYQICSCHRHSYLDNCTISYLFSLLLHLSSYSLVLTQKPDDSVKHGSSLFHSNLSLHLTQSRSQSPSRPDYLSGHRSSPFSLFSSHTSPFDVTQTFQTLDCSFFLEQLSPR